MKLTSLQIKTLRWTLRVSFLLPLAYWFYLGFTGGLGAQPIVTVNRQTGYVVLTLLILNLWLGVFISQGWLTPQGPGLKVPQWLRWIFAERRSLGIASGLYVVLHFLSYLGKEAFEQKAFLQIATKLYLAMGFIAFSMVILMLVTSNDFSVRKLGMKRWKRLHRGIHVASLFILVHIFLIEKGNLVLMAALTFPLIPFQVWRLVRFLKTKQRRAPAPLS